MNEMPHQPVIAIDIDGILNIESGTMAYRSRTLFGKDLLQKILPMVREKIIIPHKDLVVILYTSRDISRKTETLKWLSMMGIEKGINYDEIIFNKLKYDLIIDDKAYNPLDTKYTVNFRIVRYFVNKILGAINLYVK